MKIKPLADRVLIEPNPAEEKTAGGLFIPDTAKEKPLAGKVIAVGPGTADVKMEVKTGDQVLYGKYAGKLPHRRDARSRRELAGRDRFSDFLHDLHIDRHVFLQLFIHFSRSLLLYACPARRLCTCAHF